MKKWTGRLAALACTVLFAAGCGQDIPPKAETTAVQVCEESPYRAMLAGKAESFRIVCPDKKLEQYSAVMRSLRAVFGELDGGQPELISDFEAFYPAANCEIVLGATTRTEGTAYAERISALGRGKFELAIDETANRIFLLFRDTEGLMSACEALLRQVYPDSDTAGLFAGQLLERGVQRYSLSLYRALSENTVLPAGTVQTFFGKTAGGADVEAILMKDGTEAARAQTCSASDGFWKVSLALPQDEDLYELYFSVNGLTCASYPGILLKELGTESARGFTVSLDGAAQKIHETEQNAFVIAETDRSAVTVTVTCDRSFGSAAVYPSSAGITAETEGNTVTFTAPVPSKLSLELSGNTERTLELFLYAPDENRPEPGENVLWFAPGEYTYKSPIRLTSGQTVYLEAGAVVHAHFTAEDSENITIAGRGVIDTFGMTERRMIELIRCRNVTLRDYTLTGPRTWMTVLQQCDGAVLDGLNIIGTEINSDGIDIVGSSHVAVSRSYICANDDCIALKSNAASDQKNVENITVTDCILWNQEYGNAIEIGYETRCESIKNILFEDIDIIHVISGAALSIHLGDRAHVSDVTYRDIRVEDARGITVEMFIKETRYTQDTERGSISDVVIDGLHLDAGAFNGIALSGFDDTHAITGVHFRNVTLDGNSLTNSKMRSLKMQYTANITWDGESIGG